MAEKPLHFPEDAKSFQKGANTDAEGEILGRVPGAYRNAENMRPVDNAGGNGGLEKIKGEVLVHGATEPGFDTYRCIASCSLMNRKITFHASSQPSLYPPMVLADGVTIVKSFLLPYLYKHKLLLGTATNDRAGLVFDSRSGSVPLFYDIGDILNELALGNDTYFEGLELTFLQINKTTPVDKPRFYRWVDVGAAGGVKPGKIYYGLRYARLEGDATAIGPEVGPIDVPVFIMGSPVFAQAGVEGATVLDIANKTRYGPYIKFRVDNVANYERVQLIRIEFNENLGPDALPTYTIAKEFAIAPGEKSIKQYTDDGSGEIFIPPDETAISAFFIKSAKTVRYIDHRLVYFNLELETKDKTGTFRTVNGDTATPFTKNLGTAGHADPVNNCYFRRFHSGERYGFAAVYRDSAAGKSYGQVIPGMDNFRFPNRRDPKSADSAALSDGPIYAGLVDVQGPDKVGDCYEVFSHDQATGKPELNRICNVMKDAARYTYLPVGVSVPPAIIGGPPENGIYFDGALLKTSFVKPLRPTKPNDTDKFGFNYRVNTEVGDGFGVDNNSGYDPQLFEGVQHNAMGLAVHGIENIPPSVSGFEIYRTRPAKRVLFQALACWKIIPGVNTDPATKHTGKMVLVIPELQTGQLDQSLLDIFLDRPQDTSLQMVSPLGMCSEVLGGGTWVANSPPVNAAINIADLISYARVLWDGGQINPGNNSGGVEPPIGSGAPGTHYTSFGTWRNNPNGPWNQPGNDGNTPIAVTNATLVTLQAGGYVVEIDTATAVYATPDTNNILGFQAAAVKDFHEPWYVVNIVQEGRDADVEKGFITCNHYQKTRSTIGVYGGQVGSEFELVSEREDDVYSAVADDFRYIWINGKARIYSQNITIPLATILNDIANNGFWLSPDGTQVYGIYEVTTDGTSWFVRIVGNTFAVAGDEVEIRYNPMVPIRVYGDCITNPTALPIANTLCQAVVNSPILAVGPEPVQFTPNQFAIVGDILRTNGLPIPFSNYRWNDRYFVPFGLGFPANAEARVAANGCSRGGISTIRQWMVLFDCEMAANYAYVSLNSLGYTFPQANYVMRPVNYDPNASVDDNGVFLGFIPEYPIDLPSRWNYGGFRWHTSFLSDYGAKRIESALKKPEFGFQETGLLPCTGIWSEKDSPTIQNSPGLRTFPSTNICHIQNDTGGVMRLWSSGGDGGSTNLSAVTEGGVCELLISKGIAYSSDGEAFTLFKQDGFINGELWRSKHVGMPGDTFAQACEGGPQLQGTAIRRDALFFTDGRSYYLYFGGGPPVDVAKGRYMKAITDEQPVTLPFPFNTPPLPGAGAFDQNLDEAYLSPKGSPLVFATSEGTHQWIGRYTYNFDDYLYHDGRMYGVRGLEIYLLNEGWRINGEEYDAWVKFATSMFPNSRMEWPLMKFNARRKPSRVECYNEDDVLVAWVDINYPPGNDGYYLKKQDGWGHFVPVTNATVDPDQPRIQGRVMYFKVFFRGDEPDLITNAHIQTKPIV
jgi:hypothetical protein